MSPNVKSAFLPFPLWRRPHFSLPAPRLPTVVQPSTNFIGVWFRWDGALLVDSLPSVDAQLPPQKRADWCASLQQESQPEMGGWGYGGDLKGWKLNTPGGLPANPSPWRHRARRKTHSRSVIGLRAALFALPLCGHQEVVRDYRVGCLVHPNSLVLGAAGGNRSHDPWFRR